jgi:hypothetical protein
LTRTKILIYIFSTSERAPQIEESLLKLRVDFRLSDDGIRPGDKHRYLSGFRQNTGIGEINAGLIEVDEEEQDVMDLGKIECAASTIEEGR